MKTITTAEYEDLKADQNRLQALLHHRISLNHMEAGDTWHAERRSADGGVRGVYLRNGRAAIDEVLRNG